MPLTGDAVAYAAVARGADACFKWVNARGGVRGRQIRYLYVDDAYNPAEETARKTRQLVQDEDVFAIFNSVGTEHVLAVRPYLNTVGVPQLFVGSGHSALALGRKRFPPGRWDTCPVSPAKKGRWPRPLSRSHPSARQDRRPARRTRRTARTCLQASAIGLGRLSTRIRAVQTYDLSDTDLNSQIARHKSSGADTIMIFALPLGAIQAFLAVHKLAWRPRIFVNSVSIDPFVMEVVSETRAPDSSRARSRNSFLKDPTDPAHAPTRASSSTSRSCAATCPARR